MKGGKSYFQLQAFFNHGQLNSAANLTDPTSNKNHIPTVNIETENPRTSTTKPGCFTL